MSTSSPSFRALLSRRHSFDGCLDKTKTLKESIETADKEKKFDIVLSQGLEYIIIQQTKLNELATTMEASNDPVKHKSLYTRYIEILNDLEPIITIVRQSLAPVYNRSIIDYPTRTKLYSLLTSFLS